MNENNSLNGSPNAIMSAISSEQFSKLTEENQKIVLGDIREASVREVGIMGQLFGANRGNAAMHITLVICTLLVIVGIICDCSGNEKWDVIIASITAGMGFLFGKSQK